MQIGKSTRVVSALVLLCALAAPAALESQCAVANTVVSSAGTQIQVFKTLSNSYDCALTASNASFCTPTTAGTTTNFLLATAMTATVNPYCNWSCAGCPGSAPHSTIDGSDGLPVELMDFGFEDESSDS